MTTVPRERPILFSGEVVRAILAGRKTQTRRVVMLPSWSTGDWSDFEYDGVDALTICADTGCQARVPCPYGQPGGRLWVRENVFRDSRDPDLVIYAATADLYRQKGEPVKRCTYPDSDSTQEYPTHESSLRNLRTPPTAKWWSLRPSIHMPRWASRIELEVTDVRVERIRSISADDCRAEGAPGGDSTNELGWRYSFGSLWNRIHEARGYGWDANPWVWCISFRCVEVAHA